MMPQLAVILTAGGSSTRFGSDKIAQQVAGVSVLERSLNAFVPIASRIVVALPPTLSDRPTLAAEVDRLRATHPPTLITFSTLGGASRAETVLNALRELSGDAEWVAIHDAARPLVSLPMIERVFAAARQHGAAAPAMPVALTIKQSATRLPAPVERTIPRSNLWAMQTPQIMRRVDLLSAYANCPIPLSDITDDVQLLELSGKRVMLVEGEESNLKLTTSIDLALAELLVARR